jgi:hypothetical protein
VKKIGAFNAFHGIIFNLRFFLLYQKSGMAKKEKNIIKISYGKIQVGQ